MEGKQYQITVRARSTYVPEQSDEDGGRFVFAYTITITNTGTNISRATTTNEIGFYRFVAVEPGNYSVEFMAPGFENRKVPSVTVNTAAEVVINQTLVVGAASTEVAVVATPGTDLEKTNATIERTLSDRVVSELPMQVYNLGRDISRLALLAPTVNRASGSNEFAGNGQRARNNNFMIDGVDNNDLSVTISAARTIPEAVQEVQIQTTAYGPNSAGTPAFNSLPSQRAARTPITEKCGTSTAATGWNRSALPTSGRD